MQEGTQPRLDPVISSARLRHAIFGVAILAALIAGPTDIRNRNRYTEGRTKCDFSIYYEASRAFFDGREPYKDVRLGGGDYYIYPPFFAIAIHPLTFFRAETAGVLWFFLNVGLLLASYGETRRLLHLALPANLEVLPLWLAIAPSAAVVRPVFSCLQNGQTGIAILFLLLFGARLVFTGCGLAAWFCGGIVLAAAAAIKLTPGLPAVAIPLVLLIAHRVRPSGDFARRAATCVAGLVAGALLWLVVTPAVVFGPEKTRALLTEHFDKVVLRQEAIHLESRTNQGIVKAVERWSVLVKGDRALPPESVIEISRHGLLAARTALLIVVIAALAAMILAGRSGTFLGLITAFSVATLASVLVSPIAWMHHHVVDVIAILFVPLFALVRGREREAKLLAFAAVAIINLFYLLRRVSPETPILGIGMAAWLVAGAVVVFVASTPMLRRSIGSAEPIALSSSGIESSHALDSCAEVRES